MYPLSWTTVLVGFLLGLGAGFGFALARGVISLFQRGSP